MLTGAAVLASLPRYPVPSAVENLAAPEPQPAA
jgi:hypothetical protein